MGIGTKRHDLLLAIALVGSALGAACGGPSAPATSPAQSATASDGGALAPSATAPGTSAAPSATAAAPVPLDLPKAASGTDVQVVFSIELYANGEIMVDQKKLPNDDALFALAKEGHARTPDLRAVIKADGTVKHQRVIHVLDLLKQSGVTKIAFGVSPIAPEPGAVTAPAVR